MKIWDWVHARERELRAAGKHRFADLMDQLSTAVCDDDHARVDAMVPELLALARANGDAWAEVFVRHWGLQSRILRRLEGDDRAISDAVALVDFAHTGKADGCPQAVCAVQDLCNAYENRDGPGYREERLEVATETIARIDPSWDCYECIHSEHASAFLEDRPAEERLAYIDAYVARRKPFSSTAAYELAGYRVEALVELRRYEEAFEFNERTLRHKGSERHHRIRVAIDRARLHALLGRTREGARALPAWDEVAATPSYFDDYSEALETLVNTLAVPNDDAVAEKMQAMASRLEAIDNAWRAFEVASRQARLAVGRGSLAAARRALSTVERVAKKLRRPELAREKLDAVRSLVRAETARAHETAAMSVEEFLAEARDLRSVEARIELLERASAQHPESAQLEKALADADERAGFAHEAAARLQSLYARTGAAADAMAAGSMLIRAGHRAELGALVDALIEKRGAHAHVAAVLTAAAHLARSERAAAAQCVTSVEADEVPDEALAYALTVATKARAFDLAERLRASVEARGIVLEGAALEAALVTATVKEDLAAVDAYSERARPPSARIGSSIRVRIGAQTVYGRRVGYALAEVDQISPSAEYLGDRWVIDPEPAHSFDEFDAVHRARRGGFHGYAFMGTDDVDLDAALRGAFGGEAQTRYSSTATRAVHRETGEQRTRRYGWVAVPESVTPLELHEAFAKCAAESDGVLLWPALARAAGLDDVANEHDRVAALWGI